mmetsp:Transcript_19662/g.20015  ORF Transcript_19662/g.20015 Transcript_19662/m.20015 type:complete len:187 (-) Transcript_19662:86-646(-)
MKLSPFFCSLIFATSSSLVARVTAVFESVGIGYCRDANGELSNNWDYSVFYSVDLPGCQAKCLAQEGCVGINWGDVFGQFTCFVGYSLMAPVVPVEKGSGLPTYLTCYRYGLETPTPTMDGCMVKKGKFGYEKCTKLNNNKCGNEALCEWDTTKKNKCTHVCDGKKKKSDCKKPTIKGKKICQFPK